MWGKHKALYSLFKQGLIKSRRCWDNSGTVTQQCDSICTEGQEFLQIRGDIEVFWFSKCSHNFAGWASQNSPNFCDCLLNGCYAEISLFSLMSKLSSISGFTVATVTLSQFDGQPYLSSFPWYFPSPSLAEKRLLTNSVSLAVTASLFFSSAS